MYRSYSYNDMPKPITQKKCDKPLSPPQKEMAKCKEEKKEGNFIFGNFEADDIILLIVILALILEDCEDKLLIAALGFIFVSELL